MQIPDEMLKEIRESGYDQELIYNYIRELLNSEKQIKENNNLELIDNYLLDKGRLIMTCGNPIKHKLQKAVDNWLDMFSVERKLSDEQMECMQFLFFLNETFFIRSSKIQ